MDLNRHPIWVALEYTANECREKSRKAALLKAGIKIKGYKYKKDREQRLARMNEINITMKTAKRACCNSENCMKARISSNLVCISSVWFKNPNANITDSNKRPKVHVELTEKEMEEVCFNDMKDFKDSWIKNIELNTKEKRKEVLRKEDELMAIVMNDETSEEEQDGELKLDENEDQAQVSSNDVYENPSNENVLLPKEYSDDLKDHQGKRDDFEVQVEQSFDELHKKYVKKLKTR